MVLEHEIFETTQIITQVEPAPITSQGELSVYSLYQVWNSFWNTLNRYKLQYQTVIKNVPIGSTKSEVLTTVQNAIPSKFDNHTVDKSYKFTEAELIHNLKRSEITTTDETWSFDTFVYSGTGRIVEFPPIYSGWNVDPLDADFYIFPTLTHFYKNNTTTTEIESVIFNYFPNVIRAFLPGEGDTFLTVDKSHTDWTQDKVSTVTFDFEGDTLSRYYIDVRVPITGFTPPDEKKSDIFPLLKFVWGDSLQDEDGGSVIIASVQGDVLKGSSESLVKSEGKEVIPDIVYGENIDHSKTIFHKINSKITGTTVTTYDIWYKLFAIKPEISGNWVVGNQVDTGDPQDIQFNITFSGEVNKGFEYEDIASLLIHLAETNIPNIDEYEENGINLKSITQQSKSTTHNKLEAIAIWIGTPLDIIPTVVFQPPWTSKYNFEKQRYVFTGLWSGIIAGQMVEHAILREMNEKLVRNPIDIIDGKTVDKTKTRMEVLLDAQNFLRVIVTMESEVYIIKKMNLNSIRLLLISGFIYSGYKIFL